MAIKRSNAINTVIQDEIEIVAYNKNILRRQCNRDGPMNIFSKMPLCFSIVTSRYTFSVLANANSKFIITYFLREPNNTTMIMRLFARIPTVQIVRVRIVELGSVDPVLLCFKIGVPFMETNEPYDIMSSFIFFIMSPTI